MIMFRLENMLQRHMLCIIEVRFFVLARPLLDSLLQRGPKSQWPLYGTNLEAPLR